ncbi:unnamed protein product [Mytilus edulis]|uniref:Ankyrin repeat protein n=1 Tax=Mytilus edulis TaxID=6550 RepID=A0A8S3VKC0_MYTED|nr:unnamed protein product [Mytilus edulis]
MSVVLFQDYDGWTALMFAASEGHVEVSRLLLENRCNKDITSWGGRTALMLAARRGHVEVSRLLLENRCNKDITTRDGKTALHLAAEYGGLHVTRCLVEEGGISPFVKTHEGKTPYDLAAARGFYGQNKEVMEYLQDNLEKNHRAILRYPDPEIGLNMGRYWNKDIPGISRDHPDHKYPSRKSCDNPVLRIHQVLVSGNYPDVRIYRFDCIEFALR